MNLKEAYRTLIEQTKGNKPEFLDEAIEVVVEHLKERFIHEDVKDALIGVGFVEIKADHDLTILVKDKLNLLHKQGFSLWGLCYKSDGNLHCIGKFEPDPVKLLTALATLGVISID